MADIERGTQPNTRPWRLVMVPLALLFAVLLGLAIPHCYQWLSSASAPPATVAPAQPFVLGDWEYPGAKSLTKMEGGSTETKWSGVPVAQTFVPSLYAYSTPDALEKVWSHYAKLSGVDGQEFKPGESDAKTDFAGKVSSTGGGVSMGGVLAFTGDRGRMPVRTGTMVTQRPGYTVAVFLSRGKDEDQTHLNIVVEKKPSLPSP
jgi:hypothetical protein